MKGEVYEKKCVLINEHGIHARPSSLIVATSVKLGVPPNTVFIEDVSEGCQADVTSIMSIMMLAAARGTELRIFTHETNQHRAVDELTELIGKMEFD